MEYILLLQTYLTKDRVILPAWRAGKQLVEQPIFVRSDRNFTGRKIIHSASVATNRSGNERAVNRCKQSGYIKRSLQRNDKPKLLDDAWLAWPFQSNVMYRAVL